MSTSTPIPLSPTSHQYRGENQETMDSPQDFARHTPTPRGAHPWNALGNMLTYDNHNTAKNTPDHQNISTQLQLSRAGNDNPYFKIQRKGELEKRHVPVSDIRSWKDLTNFIYETYGTTDPQIFTYEGDIVTQTNFNKYTVDKQHLIISVPFDTKARNEALRALTEQITVNVQDPSGTGNYTSPMSPSRAAFDARHQKLNQENQSVKALAEHVRLMAEQTLRQYEEEGVEVMPTNQMRTPTNSETTSNYFTPPPSERYYGSVSPGVPSTTRSPMRTPNSDVGQWRPPTNSKDMNRLGVLRTERDIRPQGSVSPSLSSNSVSQISQQVPIQQEENDDDAGWSFSHDPNVYYPALGQASTSGSTGDITQLRKPSRTADERLEQLISIRSLAISKSQEPEENDENQHEIISNEEIIFDPQSDHIDKEEAQHILLCPHITFHTAKPINLKINVTPTVTVIPPSAPQDHERFFVTSIGEKLDVDLALKTDGKITEIVTMPEGDAQEESITMFSKSQAKATGPKYYVSRMEAQQAGAWGTADVGELGGHGDDGKKRNGGEMVDFAFKGYENAKRSFALAFDKVGEFIDLFMDTCGFPARERDTMRTFWVRRLPSKPSKTHFLLVRLVPVKTMASLLPISVLPEPDRIVRFFLLMRIASKTTIKDEGLEISGVMSDCVYEVLDAKARPLVPITRGGKRGRGRGGNRGVTRGGGVGRPTPERKVVLAEQPTSGLTVFEYGGLLLANKDMQECDMPKIPVEESCQNPFPVEKLDIEKSAALYKKEAIESESSDDEMEIESNESDSESVQQNIFSPSGQSHETTSTTASSVYDPSANDLYMKDFMQHDSPYVPPNTLPSEYWTGYSFPQEEQKFNFGDYFSTIVPSSQLDQTFSPRDTGTTGFNSYGNTSDSMGWPAQNGHMYGS